MRIFVTLVFCLISLHAHSQSFEYMTSGPEQGFSNAGKPEAVVNKNYLLDTEFLNSIYDVLPEATYVNTDYVSDDLRSNIYLDETYEGNIEIEVRFLNEGAGYRNGVGFFVFDPDNPPSSTSELSHTLIFPNASKQYSGGELLQGDSLIIGSDFTQGQAIGFFVVANGWSGYKGNMRSGHRGVFYSLSNLNPEPKDRTPDISKHTVMFYDSVNQELIIGFEDLYRTGGDHDFNDVLLSIKVSPADALVGIEPDGTVDPNRYNETIREQAQSFKKYYPSENSYATLAFEDKWPFQGDFDFNDVVVKYRLIETTNAEGDVTQVDIQGYISALGGSYHNGLAFRLPQISQSHIDLAQLSYEVNGVASPNPLESEADDVVFIISPDLWQHHTSATGCLYYRTESGCSGETLYQFSLSAPMATPISKSLMPELPYDPFIFASETGPRGALGYNPGRGLEIHLKDIAPTNLFNTDLYTLGDDASHPDTQAFFKTLKGLPWAISVNHEWSHPLEKVDVLGAYPSMRDWAESGGMTKNTWYMPEFRNPSKVFD